MLISDWLLILQSQNGSQNKSSQCLKAHLALPICHNADYPPSILKPSSLLSSFLLSVIIGKKRGARRQRSELPKYSEDVRVKAAGIATQAPEISLLYKKRIFIFDLLLCLYHPTSEM
ncbi:hypothetical protein ACTXT7_000507 [Hymenolepis weldensis]